MNSIFETLVSTFCCHNDQFLTIEDFSTDLSALTGYTPDEIRTKYNNHLIELSVPEDQVVIRQKITDQLKFGSTVDLSFQIVNKSGKKIWLLHKSILQTKDDGKEYLYGILTDITKTKELHDDTRKTLEEYRMRAEQDALTKLLNHDATRTQCEEYLSVSSDVYCALLIIDLDNFKYINDHLGHLFGDSILIRAATAIRKLFRSQDIVGRIGGDEFLVLIKDVENQDLIKERCQHLISEINEMLKEHPSQIRSSCSIGVSFAPVHGITYNALFTHADQALYHAKSFGRNCYKIYEAENV